MTGTRVATFFHGLEECLVWSCDRQQIILWDSREFLPKTGHRRRLAARVNESWWTWRSGGAGHQQLLEAGVAAAAARAGIGKLAPHDLALNDRLGIEPDAA